MIANDGVFDDVFHFLIQNKIDSNDIIIENQSRNTKENAINSAKILDKKNEYNSIAIQEETLCNIENEGTPF